MIGYRELLQTYQFFFQKIPGKFAIFVLLSFLVSMTESIGVMMFLPLIDNMILQEEVGEIQRDGNQFALFFDYIGQNFSQIELIIIIAAIFLVKSLISFALNGYKGQIVASELDALRLSILQKYKALSYDSFTKRSSGHYLNVLGEQVNITLKSFAASTTLVSSMVAASVYISIMLGYSVLFTTYLMVYALAAFAIMSFLIRRASFLSKLSSDIYSRMNGNLVQYVRGIKYLKSTGREEQIIQKLKDSSKKYSKTHFSAVIVSSMVQAANDFLIVFFVLGVLFLNQVFQYMSLSDLVVLIVVSHKASAAVFSMQSAAQAVAARVSGVSVVSSELKLSDEQSVVDCEPINFEDELRLENISFSYPGSSKNILNRANLTIKKNSSLVISGASGCGKTTLINILMGIYKITEGIIYVDGERRSISCPILFRRSVGYVSQESVLFNASILDNVSFFDCSVDAISREQRVIDALKLVELYDFVMGLERTIYTDIGESGFKLSGGQAQRITLAREIYKMPDILILDEGTSALDRITEQKIYSNLARVQGRNLTTIYITHKPDSIKNHAEFYKIEEGKFVSQEMQN